MASGARISRLFQPGIGGRGRLARLDAALLHDLKLHLLDLGKALPLLGYQIIHFLMQMAYLQLRLQIHPVIVEGAQAILRLLPLLTHHDDRRLNGGDAGEHEIQQDEGIGVKG